MRLTVWVGIWNGVLIAILAAFASSATAAVHSEWAFVGDANNPADANGRGSVPYNYAIGTCEVTNAEYVEFLNAKAASDPFALYNAKMTSNACGGILRSGDDGGYTYAAKPGHENQPVVYVTWFDAVRFANWCNNGKGSGDTETGAYEVHVNNGFTGASLRSANARIFLPTENEWYKAAYYQPARAAGGQRYWRYATRSDDDPHSAPPPGGAVAINAANGYRNDGNGAGVDGGYAMSGSDAFDPNQNYLSDVSAYALAASFYGTHDQVGNVWEWNETEVNNWGMGIGGGSWANGFAFAQSGVRNFYPEDFDENVIGFRLAAIPEPGAIAMLLLISALASGRSRR